MSEPTRKAGGFAVLVRFADPANGDFFGERCEINAPKGGYGWTAAEEEARRVAKLPGILGASVHKLAAARKLLENSRISCERAAARRAAKAKG